MSNLSSLRRQRITRLLAEFCLIAFITACGSARAEDKGNEISLEMALVKGKEGGIPVYVACILTNNLDKDFRTYSFQTWGGNELVFVLPDGKEKQTGLFTDKIDGQTMADVVLKPSERIVKKVNVFSLMQDFKTPPGVYKVYWKLHEYPSLKEYRSREIFILVE